MEQDWPFNDQGQKRWRNLQTRKPLALLNKKKWKYHNGFIYLADDIDLLAIRFIKVIGWLVPTNVHEGRLIYLIWEQNYSHSVEKIKGKLVTNTTTNFVWKFGLLTLLSGSFPHTCDYVVYRAYHPDLNWK